MATADAISIVPDLPANATNAEALAWVARMRRLLDRWETLPGHESRSMTPELGQQAYAELDEVERNVRRNMAAPEGA